MTGQTYKTFIGVNYNDNAVTSVKLSDGFELKMMTKIKGLTDDIIFLHNLTQFW